MLVLLEADMNLLDEVGGYNHSVKKRFCAAENFGGWSVVERKVSADVRFRMCFSNRASIYPS